MESVVIVTLWGITPYGRLWEEDAKRMPSVALHRLCRVAWPPEELGLQDDADSNGTHEYTLVCADLVNVIFTVPLNKNCSRHGWKVTLSPLPKT
eukprot:6487585-Amphidinium_carterae.1